MRTDNRGCDRKTVRVVLVCSLPVLVAGRVLAEQGALTPKDLTVLESRHNEMMKRYLTALVDGHFARRNAVLAKLKTAQDWERHADSIRKSMLAWTGPFPPRTPLNVRLTGVIDRENYCVRKILFESRPGFLVSANLYLPKGHDGRKSWFGTSFGQWTIWFPGRTWIRSGLCARVVTRIDKQRRSKRLLSSLAGASEDN